MPPSGGDGGDDDAAAVGQLADRQLAPHLEPDDEEEQRHQPVVDPVAEVHRQLGVADADRDLGGPQVLVGARPRASSPTRARRARRRAAARRCPPRSAGSCAAARRAARRARAAAAGSASGAIRRLTSRERRPKNRRRVRPSPSNLRSPAAYGQVMAPSPRLRGCRAIARLQASVRPPRLIGIAFDCQEVPLVPDEWHDVIIPEILTESGLRRFE